MAETRRIGCAICWSAVVLAAIISQRTRWTDAGRTEGSDGVNFGAVKSRVGEVIHHPNGKIDFATPLITGDEGDPLAD